MTRPPDIPRDFITKPTKPHAGGATWKSSARTAFLCALVLGVLVLVGCSLNKRAPVKVAFVLAAHRPEGTRPAGDSATLRVRLLTVAPPFDGRSFVYRNSDLNYESDFYHEFAVAPRALLSEQVRQWLEASGLFRVVLGPASRDDTTHSLDGHVTELYADFRNKAAPQVALAIDFLLIRDHAAAPEILFQKVYRQQTPANNRSPEALAQAWSKALEQILSGLEQDLEKVKR